jgi:hypothetical protein
MWRGVEARLFALDGRLEQAEALAREAVRLAEPTDMLLLAVQNTSAAPGRQGQAQRRVPLRPQRAAAAAR